MLSPHCCVGYSLVAVSEVLIAVASLAVKYRPLRIRLQSWLPGSRAQAQWLWCTGLEVPQYVGSSGSGIEPESPALAS